MRITRLAVLIAMVLSFVAAPARADIIDFGVNILSTGSTTQIEDGFWGDNNGYTLANRCRLLVICTQSSYDFSIDTTALEGSLESAELSFDISGQGLLEFFIVSALSNTFQYIGLLGTGPMALNLNTFADEIENGLLTVRVRTVTPYAESVRLDGANLRVDARTSVPEPATALLMGLGLAATAVVQRRRRRVPR